MCPLSIVNLIADNMILFVVNIIYFFVIVIELLANIQKGTKRIFKVGRLQLLVGVHSYFFFNVNVKMQQSFAPLQITPLIRSPQFSWTLDNTKIFYHSNRKSNWKSVGYTIQLFFSKKCTNELNDAIIWQCFQLKLNNLGSKFGYSYGYSWLVKLTFFGLFG